MSHTHESHAPSLRPPTRTTRHQFPARAAVVPGWDDGWQRAVDDALGHAGPAPGGAEGVVVGRVCRVDAGACDVLLAADDTVHRTTARWSAAVHRRAADDPTAVPATGDWVVLTPFQGAQRDAPWSLTAVLPRRTAVERLGVSGSSHGQVLAANADVVAIVEGMVPDLDVGRLERLLALAWSSGAQPAVLLTKADLHPDPAAAVRRVTSAAAGALVEVLPVSAPLGSGLEQAFGWLDAGLTVALLGASGVGKSTLVNALVGDVVMATRSLGTEGKGRHTTVTRELHLARAGAVLDTPGLRAVGLHDADGLDDLFADVAELAAGCRFSDCQHTVEPGCAVLEAVADGALPARRLESWRSLGREAAFQARRNDARLRAEYAAGIKARQRAYRARPDKKR